MLNSSRLGILQQNAYMNSAAAKTKFVYIYICRVEHVVEISTRITLADDSGIFLVNAKQYSVSCRQRPKSQPDLLRMRRHVLFLQMTQVLYL